MCFFLIPYCHPNFLLTFVFLILYLFSASCLNLKSFLVVLKLPSWPLSLICKPAAAAKLLQSCLTLQPQRRQPTRLPCPCDSLGKNTGCHFLLQGMKVKVKSLSRVQLCDPMDCSLPGSSAHGIFQAKVLEWGAIAFSASANLESLKFREHLCAL